MKETIYWKNFLIKVAQQTQKPLTSPIRFKLWPQIRKVISEVTSRIREQDRRSWFVVLLTWRKIKQIKRQWSVMVDLGFVWWCLQVSTVPVIRQGSCGWVQFLIFLWASLLLPMLEFINPVKLTQISYQIPVRLDF